MERQAQKPPVQTEAAEAEEEKDPPVKETGEAKQRKRQWTILLIVLLIAFAFVSVEIGLYARSHNHIPEMRTAEPGYLSLNEYVLIDTATGEKTQILTNAQFTSETTFTFGFKQYETVRGLKPGDSWEAFVKAYGDCIPEKIEIESAEGKEEIQIEPGITIEQFDQNYIRSGRVNFAEDRADLWFFTATDGLNLYYTEDQYHTLQEKFNDSPRILHPLQKYDDFAGYRLIFHFDASTLGPGDLQMITSMRID
jgi:hypothetical protein